MVEISDLRIVIALIVFECYWLLSLSLTDWKFVGWQMQV